MYKALNVMKYYHKFYLSVIFFSIKLRSERRELFFDMYKSLKIARNKYEYTFITIISQISHIKQCTK